MQAKQREELAEFAEIEHRAATDASAQLAAQLEAAKREVPLYDSPLPYVYSRPTFPYSCGGSGTLRGGSEHSHCSLRYHGPTSWTKRAYWRQAASCSTVVAW